MNKYLLIAIGVLVVAAAGAFGVGILFRPNATPVTPVTQGTTPATPVTTVVVTTNPQQQSNTQSQKDVQTTFQAQIPASNSDHIKPYNTNVVGEYALQLWKGDNMGGEALFKYDATKSAWMLVTGGGGAWSVNGLVAAGVPRDTAVALLQGLPQ